MPDFLLELRSEEIPARMQARAAADLARLFTEHFAAAGLAASRIETHATPRRLALIARDLPDATAATSEERRGPRADAPAAAIEGFLKSTGLTRDQLEERTDKKGTFLYATMAKPGRATANMLGLAIPVIIRTFPWPKSMRWGDASASTESLRWVRPLQGIVALLGTDIIPCEIAGIHASATTVGHRFHHPGPITLGGAHDYEAKLRACHVILDADERAAIIADGARAAASAAGLTLVEDAGLLAENAGLTEWPVPLLGRFDPAFLQVPPEVIVLTMRTNQKYFSCTDAAGNLAPAFVCTANIEAADGGAAIIRGNERVLSARLADAKFFWDADLKVPLEIQAAKLDQIVFHEKLGTVADKVERVAKLARWLVEEGIVKPSPLAGEGQPTRSGGRERAQDTPSPSSAGAASPSPARGEGLADLAARAARLCKADLVTQMVAEFPELQGTIGAHLARAQGEHPAVCDAIRDHYKPVGQSDEVPTAPVTVAVSLADKLDTLLAFFQMDQKPTGSKDPFALRRAALGLIALVLSSGRMFPMKDLTSRWVILNIRKGPDFSYQSAHVAMHFKEYFFQLFAYPREGNIQPLIQAIDEKAGINAIRREYPVLDIIFRDTDKQLLAFLIDRLKVQQREAGVRHDLIDAVFALGGEDDLVRLLARVRALQAFVETPEGADLLAGYKRAANILKKEGYLQGSAPAQAGAQSDEELGSRLRGSTSAEKTLSYTLEPAEEALTAALDSAEPAALAAIATEEFASAMAALATLRGPVDTFFETVTVNDPDPARREARLALLARMRSAVHRVADFSKIEG